MKTYWVSVDHRCVLHTRRSRCQPRCSTHSASSDCTTLAAVRWCIANLLRSQTDILVISVAALTASPSTYEGAIKKFCNSVW